MLDVIWMDYDTLAQRLGIGRDSARQRAKRGQWGRRRDNTGVMQVGVPAEVLEAFPDRPLDRDQERALSDQDHDHERDHVTVDRDQERDLIAGTTAILSRHIERLEAALTAAQDGLTAAHQERDEARSSERALAAQVEALNAVLSVERQRVEEWKSVADRFAGQVEALTARRPWWRRLAG